MTKHTTKGLRAFGGGEGGLEKALLSFRQNSKILTEGEEQYQRTGNLFKLLFRDKALFTFPF
jgi:hypothetical protein